MTASTFWNFVCMSYFPIVEQFKASENLNQYLDEMFKSLSDVKEKHVKNELIWKVKDHLPAVDLSQ